MEAGLLSRVLVVAPGRSPQQEQVHIGTSRGVHHSAALLRHACRPGTCTAWALAAPRRQQAAWLQAALLLVTEIGALLHTAAAAAQVVYTHLGSRAGPLSRKCAGKYGQTASEQQQKRNRKQQHSTLAQGGAQSGHSSGNKVPAAANMQQTHWVKKSYLHYCSCSQEHKQ